MPAASCHLCAVVYWCDWCHPPQAPCHCFLPSVACQACRPSSADASKVLWSSSSTTALHTTPSISLIVFLLALAPPLCPPPLHLSSLPVPR
ncbi:hypothetical protein BDA96_03G274400 [Sorghum bicolor]|uniref:Uncharacterized protein n=2 Tax=Sorghum bicolor TaxID=4558 RepID=A0A1B6Q594_SORBI|nr:hypothetical protein BDA96_03G274400 [Sorghum bicolor]KXG33098.1 hypothetical protein SORBI_3003G253900 [Sorghum bicolor]